MVQMERSACKCTSLKPGLMVENLHTLRIDDTIAPPLRCLITTTTMADNMLGFMLQKILSLTRLVVEYES